MKRLLLSMILFCVWIQYSFAQTMPKGMNYQAVARNLNGEIMSNESITLKINLVSNMNQERRSYFSETHTITTNDLGLFSLIVGEGIQEQGTFNDVPWSTENIWMEVAIKDKSQSVFSTISNSKLFAVPYAMHAITANTLIGDNTQLKEQSKDKLSSLLPTIGVISTSWSVFGNAKTDASGNIYRLNSLGTTDFVDLFLITDNVERLRITASGDIKTKLNFEIGKSVLLNAISGSTVNNGMLTVNKSTTLNDSLTVTNMKPTMLTGKLRVDKSTTLNDTLTVAGMKPTILTGTLTVEKDVNFKGRVSIGAALSLKDSFIIQNMAPALLTGKLVVDKTTLLKDSLTVLAVSTLNNKLIVIKDVPDGEYLATFNNTNNGAGDGINIKLGKHRTIYAPPGFVDSLSNAAKQQIKDLINCNFSLSAKGPILRDIILEGALGDFQLIGGLTVGIGNLLIDNINASLGLPWGIPSIPIWPGTQIFPGLRLRANFDLEFDDFTVDFGSIPELRIPKLDLPAVPNLIPRIPNASLATFGIPDIPLTDLNFWGVPNFCLTDDVSAGTPLNNENVYIQFSDKNNIKMGSIRAVSLTDWSSNYLNPLFLFKLRGALTSSIVDKKHALFHFKAEVNTAIKAYREIGVEYTSGNGDYAEWLERSNPIEHLNAGDIVGVISGKITKDLSNAEQIMAVSQKPIVLGNLPQAGKIAYGNNVAFMGQIPVKVMGPVSSGDYIMGNNETPGYGIAKNPSIMTVIDFKYAVGRSWENNETQGPVLVNTVIGIHNGDFIKILKGYEEKLQKSELKHQSMELKAEARFQTLEQKMDVLLNKISAKSNN